MRLTIRDYELALRGCRVTIEELQAELREVQADELAERLASAESALMPYSLAAREHFAKYAPSPTPNVRIGRVG